MYNFTPSTIPNNVFVIGAGGTGGRLIPLLTQFLRSITRGQSPTGWIESPKVWVIDDDVVEQKNILRQNFIDRDVGKHKAVVIAERYSKAYGVNVIPITTRITSAGAADFYKLINDHLFVQNGNIDTVKFDSIIGNSIVVICVDSVEARRDIFNVFIRPAVRGMAANKTFFIDAGNEDNFGQVSFFTSTFLLKSTTSEKSKEIPKLCPVSANIDYIPMDLEFYKNLVDTPAQGSCADLNQTLAINAIMATNIMGVLQNYFYRKPMSYNSINISLDGGNSTTYNTFNVLNNRGITADDWAKYRNYGVHSIEKDGKKKPLNFLSNVDVVEGSTMRSLLLKQLEEIIKEAERARKKAEAEAAEKAENERIKTIADRKRAEIRAQVLAAKRAKEAEAMGVQVSTSSMDPVSGMPVPPVIPNLVITPAVSSAPLPPPPLVPQRRNRNVVQLEVPSAWVETTEAEEVEEEF